MKLWKPSAPRLLSPILACLLGGSLESAELFDDRAITVHSARDVKRKRREVLRTLYRGCFRLEIDEVAPSHMISHHALEGIILPELHLAR